MFAKSSSPSSRPPAGPRTGYRLAKGLGWFSLALGVAEMLRSRQTARTTGLQDYEGLLPLYGAREAVVGTALLASRRPDRWMWARVAGDARDIATLGLSLVKGPEERRPRTVATLLAVAAVTALDVACIRALRSDRKQASRQRVSHYTTLSGFPRPANEMRGAAASPSSSSDSPRQVPQDGRSAQSRGHAGTHESILAGDPHATTASTSFGSAL